MTYQILIFEVRNIFSLPRKKNFTLIFILLLLTIISLSPIVITNAHAHIGEEERWLLSSYIAGNLNLTPDPSLQQWKEAIMMTITSLDMKPMSVMTIHNGTYILFMIQRDLNTSINNTGVLIAFEKAGANESDVIWAWISGKTFSPSDPTLKTNYSVIDNKLIVVFGRELNSTNTAFQLAIGEQYRDFIKLTSWTNTTNLESINIEELDHINLELLPYLDVYPKSSIIYSIILLLGTIGFLWLEIRRYK